MNNSTDDSATETNSKVSSDDNREEEQTTLPTESSRDDDIPDKKKVIVVTPTSTNIEEKTTTATTTTNATQQPSSSDEEQQQSSVPAKAKETGQTLKEKVKSAGMKTITKTEEKTKRLKDKSEQTAGISSEKNAHDIQALDSTRLERLATVFEDTMSKIDEEPNYEEQEKQLKGYKKLLEEQINVIDSRLKMAKRLKKR
ncbi:MAG: hypothetical protein JO297_01420 [Nitrososphaeraceae archaeon]|nr:hypothetical protein [Nitrososphaeraceae archaeon]